MILAILFFITALLYASVGFGGGSTYNALLVIGDVDYRVIPMIALSCNIIVVAGGVWHFARQGHLDIKQVLPWIALSIPAALVGGMMQISEHIFIGILGFGLLASGAKMLIPDTAYDPDLSPKSTPAFVPYVIGGGLGLIAGITGIGGGIFLAPVLHLVRFSTAKTIAGVCSLFILVNSSAGLIGQLIKAKGSIDLATAVSPYLTLIPMVLIGGQIGSWLGAKKINASLLKKITALLILYVAVRLLWRFYGMI